MKKWLWFHTVLLVLSIASAVPASAQNFVTVTASSIGNGGSGLLPSGTISFQATGTNGRPISYRVGGGGQQILAPTVCSVANGAITGACLVANIAVTQPQNFCFSTVVKNSFGQVVLGGSNTGYQCLQPTQNGPWCTAGVCNFDTFTPTSAPSTIVVINMPLPQLLTLGGIFAGDCAAGTVVIGYNSTGHPDCGPGGGGSTGGSIWGGITGVLADQTDLFAALGLLAPLTSPALLGAPTTPAPGINDNSNQVVNSSWVNSKGYATLASPAFTGTPTAPTPITADSSTKLATTAWVNAQGYASGTGNMTGPGTSVVGDMALFNSTNGQVTSDAGFGFPLAPTHIGTLVAGSNGLAPSATTDTTNAANIATGTIASARLPAPSASNRGAVISFASIAHQFLTSLSTAGSFTSSQPACGDLSNSTPSCSIDTTNASNISSGTLGNFRIGTLVAGSNGLALSATTDTTNATNITTGTLAGPRMTAVNLASSANGGVFGILPATQVSTGYPATSISGTLPAGQVGSGYPFGSLTGTANIAVAGTFPNLTSTCAAGQSWAVAGYSNASVTLTGACTINLTGLVTGGQYVLKVTQGGAGSNTLALGTGCTWLVSSNSHGVISPSVTVGAVDLLVFIYDGANCLANYTKTYN